MPSLEPEQKHDFGISKTPLPLPVRKHHFGMDRTPSPLPDQRHHFGIRKTPSPSPSLDIRHVRTTSLPLPEQKHGFGIRRMPSPLPVPKNKGDSGVREPLFLPDPEDDFEMLLPLLPEPQGFSTRASLSYGGLAQSEERGGAAHSVSPLPHSEDFGVLAVSEEGPSQIGTHQLTEAKEPFSSSSKSRGELHITSSYTHLTPVHVA